MKDTTRIVFNAKADLKFTKNTDAAVDKIGTLNGYCMVWNVLSSDRGGYFVRLLPKSAKFSTPTLAYFQHDPKAVVGNTANGSLRLFTDDVGVRVEIDLPDTTTGRDVEELVEKGYVTGMSFAMSDAPDFFPTVEEGKRIANAKGFTVKEVTVTAIPAFTETSVSVLEDDVAEEDEAVVGAEELSQKNRLESLRLERIRLEFMRI